MKKSKMYKIIYENYNNYKVFINKTNLPDLCIELANEENNTFAYFDLNDLFKNQYILYVNIKLFDFNEKFVKSILFHEFTHLYDYLQLKESFSRDNIIELMNTYSEYNASKTELMCQLYEHERYTNKKNMNNTVWYKNDNVSINNYIIYPLSDLLVNLEDRKDMLLSLNDYDFRKQCNNTEKFAIYYFGKLDFCIEHLNGRVIDLLKEDTPLYKELNNIHMILQNTCDITDKVDLIIKYAQEFERSFYFKFKK